MSALSENCHHDRATVDGEHRMQIELIEALQASLHHPTGTRPGPTALYGPIAVILRSAFHVGRIAHALLRLPGA